MSECQREKLESAANFPYVIVKHSKRCFVQDYQSSMYCLSPTELQDDDNRAWSRFSIDK